MSELFIFYGSLLVCMFAAIGYTVHVYHKHRKAEHA